MFVYVPEKKKQKGSSQRDTDRWTKRLFYTGPVFSVDVRNLKNAQNQKVNIQTFPSFFPNVTEKPKKTTLLRTRWKTIYISSCFTKTAPFITAYDVSRKPIR